jgi:hypothetical protein
MIIKTEKFTTGPNKVLLVLGQMMVLIMRTEQSFTGLGPKDWSSS